MATCARIPKPYENIGCQDLLNMEDVVHCGHLRKKKKLINKTKLFNWPQVYVVLHNGCIYYYRNEYRRKALGRFSLYGYNSVTRDKEDSNLNAFVITHTNPTEFRAYCFSAASERERQIWMKFIKKQLIYANGQRSPYFDVQIQKKQKEVDTESVDYNQIESDIYQDSSSIQLSENYREMYKVKKVDEDSDEEVPELPPRPDIKKERKRHPSPHGASRSAKEMSLPDIPQENSPEVQQKHSKKCVNGQSNLLMKEMQKAQKQRQATNIQKKKGSKKDILVKQDVLENGDEVEECNAEDEESDSYWSAIYWDGYDAEKATEVIKTLGGDGTFLVRNSAKGSIKGSNTEESKTLVVYIGCATKKFHIKKDSKNDYFLEENGPHCPTIPELMYEYFLIDLPKNQGVKLQVPFKKHDDYSSDI